MNEPPRICWLSPGSPPETFPDAICALREPNGLLAAGGDLAIERLLYAYRHGIFPWYGPGQPLLWWSPDPRIVLFPGHLHVSRTLRRQLRRGGFRVCFDTAFNEVIAACAASRTNQPVDGTWITSEMQQAYRELHRLGHAHSLEVFMDGTLAGGLYGIAMGGVFFGESMFNHRPNASKIALAVLAKQLHDWSFGMIDCQVYSEHIMRFGSTLVPRVEFLSLLHEYVKLPDHPGEWRLETSLEF